MEISEQLSLKQRQNRGYNVPCRFQTVQSSFEFIFIDSVFQSLLKRSFILRTVDVGYDFQPVLIICTVMSQLLRIVLLMVFRMQQFLGPAEQTFETYKTYVSYKQFIQRSILQPEGEVFLALQKLVAICVYPSKVAFNCSKYGLVLK